MSSNLGTIEKKPHVVCIPFPAQGHINPMLKLAKLLHFKGGFYVTFVNTEYNHKRVLKARGVDSLNDIPFFRFETIPDGLPVSDDVDATQDIPSLCDSTSKTCLPHFKNLISKLKNSPDSPPVTCIISDGVMSFSLDVALELNIPEVLFWTTSACGFMCYVQYRQLIEKGLIPLKDSSDIINGYLETIIDWVPGMKEIRLKDFPTFIRTIDPNDLMVNLAIRECQRAQKASAIILNTFDALEHDVLEAFTSINMPPVYSIGPLNLLIKDITDKDLNSFGSNLWKEETECLEWLDNKEPNSVVYVNFGSITVMTRKQLVEFAWGLANTKKPFLWVIRPDLVAGKNAILPLEFIEETKERSMLSSWCPQEKVLAHFAIGGFLTHSGWNSTLESLCGGVPVICWPFFSEQQTNCRFSCKDWGIGLEIEDSKKDNIERLVLELMNGDKGKGMRERALEWKNLAQNATSEGGSSIGNLDKLICDILM